jgi:c(7)-type cytochrome triheme protein
MTNAHLKYLIAVFVFLFLPSFATGQDNNMDPAPEDWPRYKYEKKPGELKKNKYGMIDPSPDVVSLTYFPVDSYGFVDWAKAINEGLVKPREILSEKVNRPRPEDLEKFDGDILIRSKMKFMPDVIFPHAPHNVWLKCSNCHDKIFRKKAGGNGITMDGIWKGKWCGRCHDRVAFPTRNCFKCHSVPANAKTKAKK